MKMLNTIVFALATFLATTFGANAWHGDDALLKSGKTYKVDVFLFCNTQDDIGAVIASEDSNKVALEKIQAKACDIAIDQSFKVIGYAGEKQDAFGSTYFITEIEYGGKRVFMVSDVKAEPKP